MKLRRVQLRKLPFNVFPCFSAGASLKLVGPGGRGRAARVFPCFSAGASLKRGVPHHAEPPGRVFPCFSAGASLKPLGGG